MLARDVGAAVRSRRTARQIAQRRREATDRLLEAARFIPTVPEPQASAPALQCPRVAGQDVRAAGDEADTVCRRARAPAIGVDPARRARPQRHPPGRHTEGERAAQPPFQRRNESVAPRLVDPPHPARVSLQLTVLDQLGDRALGAHVALAIGDFAQPRQPFQQRARRDGEAEAQPGRQDLREGPDIDHDAGGVGAGQRHDRVTLEMKLVVVVVLQDRQPLAARQVQQRDPARRRQHHRRGILVVGRQVEGADAAARAQRLERADVQPVRVDRQRHQPRAGAHDGVPRAPVAELLDGDQIARAQQRARHEIDRHLAAAGDQHVVGAGCQPARRRQHAGDRGAQAREAARVGVSEGGAAAAAQRAAIGARERRDRHQRQVGDAAPQEDAAVRGQRGRRLDHARAGVDVDGIGARRPAAILRRHGGALADAGASAGLGRQIEAHRFRHARSRRRGGGEPARREVGQARAHEGARRRRRGDPPLARQLGVGGHHGVAVHAQGTRQVARRRQPIAGAQAAAADLVGEQAGDAPVDRGGDGAPRRRRRRTHAPDPRVKAATASGSSSRHLDQENFTNWTFCIGRRRGSIGAWTSSPRPIARACAATPSAGAPTAPRSTRSSTLAGWSTSRSTAPGSPQPFAIPTTYVRLDDVLYIHGAVASGMLRAARGRRRPVRHGDAARRPGAGALGLPPLDELPLGGDPRPRARGARRRREAPRAGRALVDRLIPGRDRAGAAVQRRRAARAPPCWRCRSRRRR